MEEKHTPEENINYGSPEHLRYSIKKLHIERDELLSQVAALTQENENLTNNYKNRLLDIQEFQNQIKALTEQVEKLKKEKQDLQLAFNIMNDPGKELSRLREERKELIPFLNAYHNRLQVLHMYTDNDWDAEAYRIEIARIKPVLDKFNDSKT